MLIKNPKIEIDPSDPFKKDALNRLESAEILTQLLGSIDEPFVLTIDSEWGTGKTVFIEMWASYLKKTEFRCLYFNAWENDFADEPLISFIGEMQSAIGKFKPEDEIKVNQYFEKAKKLSYSLLKQAIPLAARIATHGILNLDSTTEKSISDFSANMIKENIDSYEEDKMTLDNFRKNLEKFVGEITASKDGKNKPLVFFIDELDRCKPTYAVKLLERLKHLFNVTGIVFVLAIDKEQIAHSIKSLYGIGMDVDGYLRRFIDLDYRLPRASPEMFCRYLYSKYEFKEYFEERKSLEFTNDSSYLLDTFIDLSSVFNFSLRIQEQCFIQFGIALRTTNPRSPLFPIFLATLIVLKAVNKSLYDKYVNAEAGYKDVLNYIKETQKGAEFVNGLYGGALEAYMVFASFDTQNGYQPKIDECNKKLENKDLRNELRERERNIISILESLSRQKMPKILSYLAKKIEIAERFDR
ncbi:MAG: hypothetical protein GY797_35915 [Deltaproteobacteria bacterium]|nr:hypothetical protein [Deltaproteobacteria bacterium]